MFVLRIDIAALFRRVLADSSRLVFEPSDRVARYRVLAISRLRRIDLHVSVTLQGCL